jgi:hypothetical protein
MAAVAVAMLTGCGSAEPKDVAKDFSSAFLDGDGGKVCSLSTKHLQRQIISQAEQDDPGSVPIGSGLSCQAAAASLKGSFVDTLPSSPVTKSVTVDGDNAHVALEGTDSTITIALTKQDDDWKVDGFGRSGG